MKGLISFLTSKWVVQFFGLLALALLIWFAGPLIAIAGKAPLESELARWLTIAAIFVIWAIFIVVMHILAGRKDRQLMSELAGADASKSADQAASQEEVETLQRGFEEALKVLGESRTQGKGGKQCLYELPWYAIIGAPGSGKTTALVNSGLKFPLAERLGKNFVKGVSGTRNCDWWFTDEAVLLDTAGRYTTQDSHQAVDAAAWQGFLQLVKKFRPRRPLNGVLVTLSLLDLLQQTEEERDQHAAAVRRRILELYQLLGVRLPVYMLITKTDLASGFTDFFADFTQEDREQVWGETFSADDPTHPEDWLQKFDAAYDDLLQRLCKRTLKRVQEERDIQRRSMILDFPQQMALLKPLLIPFLRKALAPNRFEQPFLVRGVYFTSGTQEGTPIDRVMGILASAFKLDRQASPMFSGRGKSFFLTRLLQEVVFPEAELAGADPRIERRQKIIQFGSMAAALLITLSAIGLWIVSYNLNKAAIAKTEEQIALYRAVDISPVDSRTTFKLLLPKLDALQSIRGIWEATGLMSRFGLYQGRKLEAGADDAYEELLRGYFLPSIVSRLGERIQAKPDVLSLKAYLMLGQPEKLDPKVVEAVVRADWEQSFNTEPETTAKLVAHLQNLLKLRLQGTQLDQTLIDNTRAKLTQIPPDQQCYESFKTEMGVDHSHDFNLMENLKPDGQKVFAYSDGKDKGFGIIPGLYTAWGYTEYLKKSVVFVKSCMGQNWVLGIPDATSDPRELDRLQEKLKLKYLHDYQAYWSGVLAGVKLLPTKDMSQTINLLDILSRPDSPLRLLLVAVEKNTSLTKISSALSQAAGQIAPVTTDDQSRKLLEAAKLSVGFDAGSSSDPVRWMENYFENLNVLVRGGPGQSVPLDAVLKKAEELRNYFMLQTGGGAQAQPGAAIGNDVVGAAKMEFGRLPEPIRGWLMSLTSSGVNLGQIESEKAMEKAKKEAAAEKQKKANEQLKELGIAGAGGAAGNGGGAGGAGIGGGAGGAGNGGGAGGAGNGGGAGGAGGGNAKAGGASQCQTAFAGRYPFVRNSPQDTPLADFSKFFSPNGIFDQFFQQHLKDLVDTSPPQWRQKPSDGQSPVLSKVAIHEFELAAKIRNAFFSSGGATPMVQFDLRPLDLDANADSFHLIIEGQEIIYRHGAEKATRIQWPGQAAGSGVRIIFEKPDKTQAILSKEGAWAMFRLFDKSSLQSSGGQDKYNLTFQTEGLSARFELQTASVNNPFSLGDALGFHCPESL